MTFTEYADAREDELLAEGRRLVALVDPTLLEDRQPRVPSLILGRPPAAEVGLRLAERHPGEVR